ncbi:MAG TPA: HEAT repeat domain-containing protein [Planctomycetota bacterium]|nr:HEAT repeat domain-containing protein [Planctomycetota bacterium]
MGFSRPTAAAVLIAAWALAGCASAPKDGPAPGDAAAKPKSEEEIAREEERARPAFYQKLTGLTQSWATAYTEPGQGSANEARALESAIGLEVWKRFDMVLSDLGNSDNPRWRAAAARGLGFVVDPRVRPALEKSLGDSNNQVLCGALVSLARAADAQTDDRAVARLLTYPDAAVQGNAALCLARVFQTRHQQSLPAITPPERVPVVEVDLVLLLFHTGDPILRANAAQALGGLDSPRAEDALLNTLRDEHSFVRLKVAQALARCGSRRSLEFLLDSLGREQEKNVKFVLALAVGAVAEREGHAPPYAELGSDAGKWRAWLQK